MRGQVMVMAWCLLGVALVLSAQADPLLQTDKLSICAVAGTGGNPGIGACLSWEALGTRNGSIFADLGTFVDGSTYDGFFGVSTNRRLPVVKEIPGGARVGVGWCEPSSTWLLYAAWEVW